MLSPSSEALIPIAEFFKVLSEVSRIQVLCCLKLGDKNVTEIIEATGLGQANVSKHLKVLSQAGIVTRHPQGTSVFYSISNENGPNLNFVPEPYVAKKHRHVATAALPWPQGLTLPPHLCT